MRKNPIEILLMKEEFNERLVSNTKLKIIDNRTLLINYNVSIKEIFYFVLFFLPLILPFFLGLVMINNIGAKIFCLLFMLTFLILFFYTYYTSITPNWIINKENSLVVNEKTYLKHKKKGEIKFSEIMYLSYSGPSHIGAIYSLNFVVYFLYKFHKINDIVIYRGGEHDCKRLGIIIAEFIKKDFFQAGNYREKLN
jgi:hypothetical protein